MGKTSDAQLEASKRYLESKDVLKITLNKGTRKIIESMIPYVRNMYPAYGSKRIKTVQDFVRMSLEMTMDDIALEFGEEEIDKIHGTLLNMYFPNKEECLYLVDSSILNVD